MNFKTAQYNSLVDVEILIVVQQAKMRMLKAKLKSDTITRDTLAIKEDLVKIGSNEECIKTLNELKQSMISCINNMLESTGNLEGQIFIDKICLGLPSSKILQKRNISDATLRKYYSKIKQRLETSPYGQKLDLILSDEN